MILIVTIYGEQWTRKTVEFRVDNIAVVQMVNSLFCSDNPLMYLVRLLVFFASHIEGRYNTTANALSHNTSSYRLRRYHVLPQEFHNPINHSSTKHHLDIHQLDKTVLHYLTAALTTSSHKTYKAAECRYNQFCQNLNITSFPTSECILCYQESAKSK